MPVKTVSPAQASALISQGATLVDIREPDEYARGHIVGARNIPVGQLSRLDMPRLGPVIFHCRSGNRTSEYAERLTEATQCEAYLLDGGLDAWRKAGLPFAEDRRQPLELMRQVQIAAGSLVLVGVLLSLMVAPGFLGLSAFVGLGLIFAGSTGWCGMARLLATMPWNRRMARL